MSHRCGDGSPRRREVGIGATGLRGHLSVPPALPIGGRAPGVVVLHEAFGLTADIVDIADRLAGRGYLALAPDLYSWGPTMRCLVAAFTTMLRGRGRALARASPRGRTLRRDERSEMSALVVLLLVALAGGFAIAAQAQLSALMIDEVGPLGTVFLTYGVGAVAATVLVVGTRGGRLAGVRALPPYVYLAGILGLVIVGTISYSVAQVGVVEGLLLITVAQFAVSALIDHFGLLGAEVQPLTPAKVAGILLLLGGGWLALR